MLPKTRAGDGWFWKTQKEITRETGLTRRETDTAWCKLVTLGVLSEDLRGVPATLHFRLDKDELYQLLWEHLQKKSASETPKKLDCTKRTNKSARNGQAITEITPETTSKTTQTRAKPISPPASAGKDTEKTEAARAIIQRGAAKIKAALDAARQTGPPGTLQR